LSEIDSLALTLQPHYKHFNVKNRLLFTGHSHQAWPDVAFDGVREYLGMVAESVDLKWEKAFEKTEVLRGYLRSYYNDPDGLYCREQNTHVLLVAWLSSLDLKNKPKILTTDGEFHSMYRQLRRFQEEGLEVKRLFHHPGELLFDAIRQELDQNTAAVMLSRVYFESARINQKIPEIAGYCRRHNVPLLIDDYHGTNVVPLSIRKAGLQDAFILIGGYKYLQWGEANCFLRFPKDCNLRPAVTGWFAAFSSLDEPRINDEIQYDEGHQRFATGTYDPVSQYRAAKVVEFFNRQGLTPERLSAQYRNQIQLLRNLFLEKAFNPDIIKLTHEDPVNKTGGFLSLNSPFARKIRTDLLKKDVFTDARGPILRIGPAPYITEQQCIKMINTLSESVQKFKN